MKPRRLALSLLALYFSFLPWGLVSTRPVEIRRERVIEPHYQILTPASYAGLRKSSRA